MSIIIKNNEEKFCSECCWFYDEDSVGCGYCACKKANDVYPMIVDCSDSCDDDYVSRSDMRHQMAVILNDIRWNRKFITEIDDAHSHDMADALEFSYRYMKVFSEL